MCDPVAIAPANATACDVSLLAISGIKEQLYAWFWLPNQKTIQRMLIGSAVAAMGLTWSVPCFASTT